VWRLIRACLAVAVGPTFCDHDWSDSPFLLGFGDDLIRLNSRLKLDAQVAVAMLSFSWGCGSTPCLRGPVNPCICRSCFPFL